MIEKPLPKAGPTSKAIGRWEDEGGAPKAKPEELPRDPKQVRLDHVVADFSIDRLSGTVTLILRTGDDVDHAFIFDQSVFARLAGEIMRLQAPPRLP